eukprot:11228363-Lingulodinium_polyedra.AAC.3
MPPACSPDCAAARVAAVFNECNAPSPGRVVDQAGMVTQRKHVDVRLQLGQRSLLHCRPVNEAAAPDSGCESVRRFEQCCIATPPNDIDTPPGLRQSEISGVEAVHPNGPPSLQRCLQSCAYGLQRCLCTCAAAFVHDPANVLQDEAHQRVTLGT